MAVLLVGVFNMIKDPLFIESFKSRGGPRLHQARGDSHLARRFFGGQSFRNNKSDGLTLISGELLERPLEYSQSTRRHRLRMFIRILKFRCIPA